MFVYNVFSDEVNDLIDSFLTWLDKVGAKVLTIDSAVLIAVSSATVDATLLETFSAI